jgi:Arc/MetJ family transcription regulator
MVKTTVEIDEKLLKKAMQIFSNMTKKEVLTIALRECIERRERKDLRDLFNSDEMLLAEDYDYKKMRGGVI